MEQLSKNHSSIGRYLLALATNDPSIRVEPIVVCGEGGAMVDAGMFAIDLTDSRASRNAPVTELAAHQSINSKHSAALYGNVYTHQCVNVYFQNIYLGAFIAREMKYKCLDNSELVEERKQIERMLPKLKHHYPQHFPKDKINNSHNNYNLDKFTFWEVKNAVNKIKRRKAHGPDETPMEVFKEMYETNKKMMLLVLNY